MYLVPFQYFMLYINSSFHLNIYHSTINICVFLYVGFSVIEKFCLPVNISGKPMSSSEGTSTVASLDLANESQVQRICFSTGQGGLRI